MYLDSAGPYATEVRAQIVDSDNNCDRTSNLYFWLSLLLFVTGFVFTLVILDENEFGPLAKFWLIGPICLCLAFLIAIKTLLYLRRKSLMALLVNQSQYAQVIAIMFACKCNCDRGENGVRNVRCEFSSLHRSLAL